MDIPEFRRINFFKGLFAHAEDWRAGEAYRDLKDRLHNLYFHGFGVVPGCRDDLMVAPARDGRGVVIAPGLAIDREGRELWLPQPLEVELLPDRFDPPCTVYLTARLLEELVDRRENTTNPEYSGFAFVREGVRLDLETEEPADGIELARIRFAKDARRVTAAADPPRPGDNEIDLRFRPRAGVVRGTIRLEDFALLVKEGSINVTAARPSLLRIEETQERDPERFFLVCARPLSEGRVSWQVQASVDRTGNVEYSVAFTSHQGNDVEVAFRVYRVKAL